MPVEYFRNVKLCQKLYLVLPEWTPILPWILGNLDELSLKLLKALSREIANWAISSACLLPLQI